MFTDAKIKGSCASAYESVFASGVSTVSFRSEVLEEDNLAQTRECNRLWSIAHDPSPSVVRSMFS